MREGTAVFHSLVCSIISNRYSDSLNPCLAIHEFDKSRRSPKARITAGFFVDAMFVLIRLSSVKSRFFVGFTLCHQNLGQLGHLKHTIFSSTSIKLAGGISAKDATEMAYEMKCRPDFLLGMNKGKKSSQIACYLKNVTDSAIPISFSFGELEREDVMSATSFKILIENIRKKYCCHVSELSYGSTKSEEKPKQKNDKVEVPTSQQNKK